MKVLVIVLSVFFSLQLCSQHFPDEHWDHHDDLSEIGWSAEKLKKAEDYYSGTRASAVLIVYQGKVLASWGNVDKHYVVHSIRKSFLSLLYGIYVDRKVIDISTTIGELGIDDKNPLTKKEKRATISDLLQSKSGIYLPAAATTRGGRVTRPARGSQKPGKRFYYNNWDFNALGTIFEQETGKDIYQAFQQDIGLKIGLENFDPIQDGRKYYEKDKSMHPAYHFLMTAEDMARVGLLVLNKGKWKDEQIISESWIRESTTPYTSRGYSYMWWITGRPYQMITASGLGGHQINILPGHDLVIVIRADTLNKQTLSDGQLLTLRKLILEAKNDR